MRCTIVSLLCLVCSCFSIGFGEVRQRVLITDKISKRIFTKVEGMFQANGIDVVTKPGYSASDLKRVLAEYDGVLIRSATKLTKEVIGKKSNLRCIGRAGVGLDNICMQTCNELDIRVFNSPLGNCQATSELTVGLMMCLSRQIHKAHTSTVDGRFQDRAMYVGMELKGKTLGIVGMGNIGRNVCSICRAMGMKVITNSASSSDSDLQTLGAERVNFEELLRRSDVLTVHVPLLDSTWGLIDSTAFAQMKPSALLVNTARGGIVDEPALKQALETGLISGAACDVFLQEPAYTTNDSVLLSKDIPNLLLTPHIGASTAEAQESCAIDVASKMIAHLTKG